MRQRLPETAGDALYVNDISQIIHPGAEFDAPHLVPGCVSLEPPAEASDGGEPGTGGEKDAKDPADSPGREPGRKPRTREPRP